MGNFYTSYTLRGPTQEAAAAALKGRSAIVTPTEDDCTVVFDEESDDQDMDVLSELASSLSAELQCPVLALLNHDDDILWYQLYLNGQLADDYNSSPAYFDPEAEASGPAGGDSIKLCGAFGSSNVDEVDRILHKSSLDDDGYVFAIERHTDLARALGLPSFAVGGGFSYISDGELPDGLTDDDLLRVT